MIQMVLECVVKQSLFSKISGTYSDSVSSLGQQYTFTVSGRKQLQPSPNGRLCLDQCVDTRQLKELDWLNEYVCVYGYI